jgi:hypothetical protein
LAAQRSRAHFRASLRLTNASRVSALPDRRSPTQQSTPAAFRLRYVPQRLARLLRSVMLESNAC